MRIVYVLPFVPFHLLNPSYISHELSLNTPTIVTPVHIQVGEGLLISGNKHSREYEDRYKLYILMTSVHTKKDKLYE